MRRESSSGLSGYLRSGAPELLKQQNELLNEFVRRVVGRLGRCAVFLFGSRARGSYLPYSDFDVAIVVEAAKDVISLIEELRALKPRGLQLDLIVLERGDLSDPIVKKMLDGALVFHDSLPLSSANDREH